MLERRPKRFRRTDEVTGLAGWLFTDLLLGLAIVFLATTSLQVLGSKDGSGDPCTTEYEKTYFEKPLLMEYANAQDASANISRDIDQFARDSGLIDPVVAVGLFWGNYLSSERAQQGQIRAWNFYNKGLRDASSQNFPELPDYKSEYSKNMRFLGESSSRRSIESVRIELYFIYDRCKAITPTTG